MSRGVEHTVIIQRHGRSHRASCSCGWGGHAWNELRPAEADAWHHLYGDERIVDVSESSSVARVPTAQPDRRPASLDKLVARARALAGSPSPYGKAAVAELWSLASGDRTVVQEAISEISELLWRHSRRSASTADSEWLELITAKRLLQETLEHEDLRTYR